MAMILLADDDAAVRDLVRRALASEGHNVHMTQDGAEALEFFEDKAGQIDVLVTDVDMPAIDGVSLAQKVLAKNPKVAVVLMSGFSDQLERAGELRAGRLLSISKPFTLEQIKQAVRRLLA